MSVRRDRYLSGLTKMYGLLAGDWYEIWHRTWEGEGLHEIAMRLQEESESSITRGDMAEEIVLDYWDLLEDEGLMQDGEFTSLGTRWGNQVDASATSIYYSDLISESADQEEGAQSFHPADLRSIGEIYGVLGTEGVLPAMNALVAGENLEGIEVPTDALDKMYREGFLKNGEFRKGSFELKPEARDLYRMVVEGEDGDYAWARQNLDDWT